MKQRHLLLLTLFATTIVIISSCGTSRPYYDSRPYVSLIITPSPGFIMNQYPDGRYYHRSPQGFIYLKGNDNRFFLDRRHVNSVRYSQGEYNQWKRGNQPNNNNRNHHHSH